MKVRRQKRRMTKGSKRHLDSIEARKAALEAQVARGVRDVRTLVAFPVDLARKSVVRFPLHPFGKPKPW